MEKSMVVFLIVVMFLTGCAHIPDPQTDEGRERVLRIVNSTELVLYAGLTIAELRGADPAQIANIQVNAAVAFNILRNTLDIRLGDTDPEALKVSLHALRSIVDDVLLICESAGVSPSLRAEIQTHTNQVFAVLQNVLDKLS